MLELNRIYKGDCLRLLKYLPDNVVDAVITDPLYGIDFNRNKFDPIQNDKKPFIWWIYDAYRILKDDGCMICFCRWDVQEQFRYAMEIAGFEVKSQIIWDRVIHGIGNLQSAFAPQHDTIWFAVKKSFCFQNGRPHSVVRSQRVNTETQKHPNEKPLDLMRHLIEKTTDKGDLVVDPFCGSGSTCVAAKQIGRDYIGFEIEDHYCQIAKDRLSQKILTNLEGNT